MGDGLVEAFPTRGPRVCRFIERYCVHGEGDQFGEPFVLRPWQRAIINRLFELKRDPLSGRWRRKHKRALIGFPKGNGKTELAAALGVYMLAGGEHVSPLIPVAAASKEQANLVFGAAKIMVQESPALREIAEAGVDAITLKGAPGRLYRVAAAEGTNDGQRPSCFIADELHEWRETRNTFTILSNGTAKRTDSMQLAITTAGYDLDTICGRLYEYGKRVQSGEIVDDEFFFHWLEPADGDDLDDPATWLRVNPAAGDFWPADNLARRYAELPPFQFQRYFLNRWTEAEMSWLPPAAWADCKVEPFEFDASQPMYLGWDAATKYDSTAVVASQVRKEVDAGVEAERVPVRAWVWSRPFDPRTNKLLEEWLLPIDEVVEQIWELCRTFDVRSIQFDPAFVSWEAGKLADQGLPMREFPQHTARMAVASQSLYELVVTGIIAHDGDPVLSRHVANARARQSRTGGAAWRLVKSEAGKKMDATAAMAMSIWGLQHPEPVEKPPAKPRVYTRE